MLVKEVIDCDVSPVAMFQQQIMSVYVEWVQMSTPTRCAYWGFIFPPNPFLPETQNRAMREALEVAGEKVDYVC